MTKQELIDQLSEMENYEKFYLSGGQWAFEVSRENKNYTVTPHDYSYIKMNKSECTFEEMADIIQNYLNEYQDEDFSYYNIVLDQKDLNL